MAAEGAEAGLRGLLAGSEEATEIESDDGAVIGGEGSERWDGGASESQAVLPACAAGEEEGGGAEALLKGGDSSTWLSREAGWLSGMPVGSSNQDDGAGGADDWQDRSASTAGSQPYRARVSLKVALFLFTFLPSSDAGRAECGRLPAARVMCI